MIQAYHFSDGSNTTVIEAPSKTQAKKLLPPPLNPGAVWRFVEVKPAKPRLPNVFNRPEFKPVETMRGQVKIARRNEKCPCGSGMKYKRCCQTAKRNPIRHALDSENTSK